MIITTGVADSVDDSKKLIIFGGIKDSVTNTMLFRPPLNQSASANKFVGKPGVLLVSNPIKSREITFYLMNVTARTIDGHDIPEPDVKPGENGLINGLLNIYYMRILSEDEPTKTIQFQRILHP